MTKISEGLRNKVIASDLNVTLSTVDAHKAKIMEKMEVDSVSALIRMALKLNLISEYP